MIEDGSAWLIATVIYVTFMYVVWKMEKWREKN